MKLGLKNTIKLTTFIFIVSCLLVSCEDDLTNESLDSESTHTKYIVPDVSAVKPNFVSLNAKHKPFKNSSLSKTKSLKGNKSNRRFIIDWEHSISAKFKESQNIHVL